MGKNNHGHNTHHHGHPVVFRIPAVPKQLEEFLEMLCGGDEETEIDEACECCECECGNDCSAMTTDDRYEALLREVEALRQENEDLKEEVAHLVDKYEPEVYDDEIVPSINPLRDISRVYISGLDNGKIMTVVMFADGSKTKAVWDGTDTYSVINGILICVMKRQNATHISDDNFVCSSDVRKLIAFIDKNLENADCGKKSIISYPDKKKMMKAQARADKKSNDKSNTRSSFKGKPEEWEKFKQKVLDYKRANLDKTVTEIAKEFSMSDSTVSKWLKEAGLRDDVRIGQVSVDRDTAEAVVDKFIENFNEIKEEITEVSTPEQGDTDINLEKGESSSEDTVD